MQLRHSNENTSPASCQQGCPDGIRGGDIGYSDIKLTAKSVYGEYELDDEMRRVLRNSKYEALSSIRSRPNLKRILKSGMQRWRGGCTVDRRDMECGKGAVRILVPHCEAIVSAFHSPLFPDGAFSSSGRDGPKIARVH